VVLLALVWSMKAGVKPGLNLHLLGATMFTLMFGRQLAIIGLSLVLAAVTLNWDLQGHPGWTAYALNALVLAVFPPLLADAIRRGMERWLPANFFIYVFVAAFFGAAATVIATGALLPRCSGWRTSIRRVRCSTITCLITYCWALPKPGSTARW
jgi:uncharacterized membrane protein